MPIKKKGLGKGLDSLIPDNNSMKSVTSEKTVESKEDAAAKSGVQVMKINEVEPNRDQPRKNFDEDALLELSDSIKQFGVLQPLLVRKRKDYYEIIAGERRWRASKQAGLSEIPCIIIDADELRASQLALIENIQRENLNAYEEAKAYKSLMDDFGLTQEEVSEKVGKNRSTIANSMRLLDLPEEVVELLVRGELSAGHCRALLGLRDRSSLISLSERIIKRNLSVRETEKIVRGLNSNADKKAKDETVEKELTVNYFEDLERRATGLIGRKVKISTGKNRQILQIEYTDDTDLEELLVKLCGKDIIESEL